MSYWSAKSDLSFMAAYREDVRDMWKLEDEYAIWRHPNPRHLGEAPDIRDDERYKEVRGRIAEGMNRAEAIARRHSVGHSMSAVLHDQGRFQPPRQGIEDGINRTVGAAEHEVCEEWRHVINPLWWLLQTITFILRIPIEVATLMGADREKLETEVWPRVLSSLLMVLVTAFGVWLGVR